MTDDIDTTISAAVRDYREAEGILRKDPIAGAMHIWQRLGIDLAAYKAWGTGLF